jgi:hypothetical protein
MRAMQVLALIFLALAVHRTATLALPLTAPAYMGWSLEYDGGNVAVSPDPFVLLSADTRTAVEKDPAANSAFRQRLDDRAVQLRLFLIELAGRLPELALMYFAGVGLWRMSRPGTRSALAGVPWLMRAAAAGAALAIVTPVIEAVRTSLLLQEVVPDAGFELYVDVDTVLRSLLFALAAWSAAWTISSGLRARADLAEIV